MQAAAQKIRVMIVDDSLVARGLVRNALAPDPQIEIVAAVSNGKLALETLAKQEVDVVLLDLEMPEMDGIAAIPRIRALRPAARIVISSAFTPEGSKRAVEALTAGASECIQKPTTLGQGFSVEEYGRQLQAKVRQLGQAAAIVPSRARSTLASLRVAPPTAATPSVLAVGSSTGGPNALASFFRRLTRPLPVPVFVVQHMPPSFTRMLAQRIQDDSGHISREATDGELAKPGTIYIAPGDRHLVLESAGPGIVLRLTQDPPENFCRPAVDPLFRAVARIYGAKTLAVVLTGMGEDGMRGSQEIVRAGGRVFVQDEATSVVWGMPGAVAKAGFAEKILPLEELPQAVADAIFGREQQKGVG